MRFSWRGSTLYWPLCMETKYCGHCNTEKSVDAFNRRGSKYNAWCRDCSKGWYRENKVKHVANCVRNRKSLIADNRTKLMEYLRSHPCVDCGEAELNVLEFDHVRGKKLLEVTKLLDRRWGLVSAEIEKCEVRCANCHRRKTLEAAGVDRNHW